MSKYVITVFKCSMEKGRAKLVRLIQKKKLSFKMSCF